MIRNVKEGTIVCNRCGTVAETHVIDETSEYRSFSADCSSTGGGNNQARTGGVVNPLLNDFGISTTITGANKQD